MLELAASYRALVGVAVGCGLVIAGFFEGTKDTIEANRAELLQAAITTVLPGSATVTALALNEEDTLVEAADQTATVYLARDADGNVVGFAVPATGMGYQDRIRLIWGYDPRAQTLAGYVVLENRETPGLGALIATDEKFLAQFKNLPVQVDASQTLTTPMTVVPTGTASHPGEIDALTGATVSTRAVVDILNKSLARWLPALTAYPEAEAASPEVP